MAFIVADRVKETSTTTGTGSLTLAGAVTGFQTFDAPLATNDTTYYAIEGVDGNGAPTGEWEVGLGTFTSPSTLARTTVLASSNSGAAVNLSAGTKNVFMTAPAARYGYFPNGLEVGHDSDTTLSRSAAGVLAVEGTIVKMVGKETIWIPANAMMSRTTNGPSFGLVEMGTNKNLFYTLDFSTSTQEFAQFEVFFPKSWNLSTVTFIPFWSHASTSTNFGVVWALQGIARSNDDAGDVAFGTEQTSTDTGGTTNDIYIGPESSAITIGGTPAAGDTVLFQIKRNVSDGSDTIAIDARLHGVQLLFTTNAATDA